MDRLVETRSLRSFVAVAEELHFGRAAERLGMAQPALSQRVRRLEAQLGCLLLVRTSRSVGLTPAGEVLLARARRTLGALDEDLAETRSVAAGRAGSLRVGFVGSAVLSFLPEAVRRHRIAHPLVQVHLRELHTAEVIAAVADASLDVGVVRDPDPHPALVVHRLLDEPYVALLPADHRVAAGPGATGISVAELAGDPFVFHARSAGERAFDTVMALCEQHGFRPEVTQEASHWLTILSLVRAGLGVSIAPQCISRLAGPDVACPPLRDGDVTSELCVLTRRSGAAPLAAGFLEDARAAVLAPPGPTPRGRAPGLPIS